MPGIERNARIVDEMDEVQAEIDRRKTHAFEGVITAIEPHQASPGVTGYNPVLRHSGKCARCGRQQVDSVHDVNALDEAADHWTVPQG